jgi:hypothetical protein
MATITRKHDASAAAREHTAAAIEKMAALIDSMDPRIALEAAKAILDRGHGKPINAIIQIPATQQQRRQMAAMTDLELEEAIDAEVEMPELPPPAPQQMLPGPGQSLDALEDPLLA